MKILITGGPVFEHLDSVKIITNRFKGGMIAGLADHLEDLGAEITYLCSKGSEKPEYITGPIIHHNGYEDYKNKVLSLAPQHDAVILGAAVCNLIPDTPWKNTKFPSHNYKEGDRIAVDFIVAPRIINMVRAAAPNTTLIGFKLLDGVPEETLIEAAYDVLLASGAHFVVANDASNLSRKLIITKEKSAIPVSNLDLGGFIYNALSDKHYRTWVNSDQWDEIHEDLRLARYKYEDICRIYESTLDYGYDAKRNIYFGCVAVKCDGAGFLISPRAKGMSWARPTHVSSIDHDKRVVHVNGRKASLNAPFIDKLFKQFTSAKVILHTHEIDKLLPVYDYAFPGTVRDATRDIQHREFTIAHHGSFYIK